MWWLAVVLSPHELPLEVAQEVLEGQGPSLLFIEALLHCQAVHLVALNPARQGGRRPGRQAGRRAGSQAGRQSGGQERRQANKQAGT